MKYFALCLFFATTLFADQMIFENKSSYSKLALEWASSARVAQESNEALMQGDKPTKLYSIKKPYSKITIPPNASYFRVLAWETSSNTPELLTNWVEIIPGKTYELKDEHLTSSLLLNGMGC
jgi:hypothetical protein